MDELGAIRERKRQALEAQLGSSAGPAASAANGPVTLTDATFAQAVATHRALVVDCWAPWCGPCRLISPTIEALAKEYQGRITFGKLNTDENQEVPIQYGIMSIPTLLLFKDGELVDSMVGAVPRPYIEEKLKQLV